MQPIDPRRVQQSLDALAGQEVYLHLETTRGAYAPDPYGAFARNVRIRYRRGRIAGRGPAYRVGLELEDGWVVAEGLTHWELDAAGRLLLAGHDAEGRLTVALELSREPFPMR